MDKRSNIKKKVYISIAAILCMFVMLTATTYALILSLVSADDNIFETAQVKIELNNGQAIFDGTDINIEPGCSIRKDFTVENDSTVDIYYRLYLENVSGSLRDVLILSLIHIYIGDCIR